MKNDTIAAIATPAGRGGIGIIRVSGPHVSVVAQAIVGYLPPPRYATHTSFYDKNKTILDEGIALYFPAPHSFTGEDVLELQGHGGPVILDCLLQQILKLNVRLACPGEFSERAFLNDKLDLTQAEAIADLIDAASEQAARAAIRSLQGEFSKRINPLVESVIYLRTYVEAAIDFAEEEIDFLNDGKVNSLLASILTELESILATARQGTLLREGMTVVIAGRPNAGKSSLLNALSGRDSAIVTPIPGTTRDVLRENIQIDGMPLHIIDTAGLRTSDDPIEQEGIRRAKLEIEKADRILLIVDDTDHVLPELDYKQPLTIIHNKIDLNHKTANIWQENTITHISISAKIGDGLNLLREHLKSCMGFVTQTEGNFSARRRHLDALYRAQEFLFRGKNQLETQQAGELLAEDLRVAQQALSEITGAFTSDDLLGRIFSSFCIGK